MSSLVQRTIEFLLGLDKGFLQKGDPKLDFNPKWPGQDWIDFAFKKMGFQQEGLGAGLWNVVLGALALFVVVHVYRREARGRGARVSLGILRAALLGFVILMLNRPVLTIPGQREEPSVVAVVLDDSISMRVRDVTASADGQPVTRMEAALKFLNDQDRKFLKDLAKLHTVRFYTFNQAAQPIGAIARSADPAKLPKDSTTKPVAVIPEKIIEALTTASPRGNNTQVIASLRNVLDDLQGQRVAGVVLLTDGRSNPAESLGEGFAALRGYGVKLFPIVVGSDKPVRNLGIDAVKVEDSVFKDDYVRVTLSVRGTGLPKEQPARVVLVGKKSQQPLRGLEGRPAEAIVRFVEDGPQEVEIIFRPEEVGALDFVARIEKQEGELDDEDNERELQIDVLDSKINVLYCDGYPRWEYRYLTREMIRDKTVDISCLLYSSSSGFIQEGDDNRRITRFPETMKEMLDYDAVLFGDVDPREFTDRQLLLISEFVSKKGGGFGMVAGPRWSPVAWKNTPVEPLLPVGIARTMPEDGVAITSGFRPVLTREGQASSIFRFFADKAVNEKFLKEEWQPVFWYARGITAKPAAEVYAEHPTDQAPDGKKAPILVMGKYGTGRTLFSAIDDSWRWRFYTGEQIFDNYWVQQLRHLARERKMGQRNASLTVGRPMYELGDQVTVSMTVRNIDVIQQLSDQISVDVRDAGGNLVRREKMLKQENDPNTFVAVWTADKVGKFTVKTDSINGETWQRPIEVGVPKLELAQPQVDRTLLTRLASETLGVVSDIADARALVADAPTTDKGGTGAVNAAVTRGKLAAMIPSAAKVTPNDLSEPIWNAPLAMAVFLLLIVTEWVLRKVFGML